MTITKDDVIDLMNRFHQIVMIDKGGAASQAAFFLHPEPWIIVPHGADISMQANYEIHQRLVDEKHAPFADWEITPLSRDPERVRAVGAVYWEGRLVDAARDAVIKCVVGEDWIVERTPSGELKIALYINAYHHFLPDSAPMKLA